MDVAVAYTPSPDDLRWETRASRQLEPWWRRLLLPTVFFLAPSALGLFFLASQAPIPILLSFVLALVPLILAYLYYDPSPVASKASRSYVFTASSAQLPLGEGRVLLLGPQTKAVFSEGGFLLLNDSFGLLLSIPPRVLRTIDVASLRRLLMGHGVAVREVRGSSME